MSSRSGRSDVARDERDSRNGGGDGDEKFQTASGRGRPYGFNPSRYPNQSANRIQRRPPPELELVIVDTLSKAKSASQALSRQKVVAVDCEGVRLSRTGRLCLVQVASTSKVYLYDVVVVGAKVFTEGGLKAVLEDERILKLFHDCRHDCDALFWQFNVKVANIFDTQVAFAVLREQQGLTKPIPIGLKSLLRKYSVTTADEENVKAAVKLEYSDNSDYWTIRPLPDNAIKYAKYDVEHLIHVYKQMTRYLKPQWEAKVMTGSQEYAAAYRDHADGAEKAALEFNELVKLVQAEKKALAEKREREEREQEGRRDVEC
mmetsp:Transcript_4171/g.12537  ORF Transcript_4171/g.12537 Transcript_4171/m.12537 type:complete len:317 (+) Transcript_4171:124-1074(+)